MFVKKLFRNGASKDSSASMTLQTRLNRIIISLFFLAAVLYSILIFIFQQQRIELTAEKIAVFLEGIADSAMKPLADELFEKRYRAVRIRLENIIKISGIERAAVFDTQSAVVADAGNAGSDQIMLKEKTSAETWHGIQDGILVFITPVRAYDEIFGYLIIQYPLEDFEKEESNMLILFAFTLLGVMLFILYLLNAFTRINIVSPVNRLISVMGDVKDGLLGRQIGITGTDEIRNLSRTFNSMSREISIGYDKLQQARQFIEQITNAIDSILVSIREDLSVTAWNIAAVQYTGILKKDAVGRNIFSVFPDLHPFREQIEKVIHYAEPFFIHRECINNIYYNIFIYPLAENNSTGALIRLDDITPLEEKETQLRQFQKMETVGMLAGGVAHDFNNMLGGIIGAAELLMMRNQDPETGRHLNTIMASSKRASELTAKLLAFSRRTKPESQPLDVHEAIEAVHDILKRSINKNINIYKDFKASSGIIEGNSGELQNIFLNLGINASQAMPRGGSISFETRHIDSNKIPDDAAVFNLTPGPYIEINVKDTGAGISPEYLDSVFEPFFTTKGPGKGTGLGLSAVFVAVQQLQGAVTVESRIGRGTVFHLYLPLSDREPAPKKISCTVPVSGSGLILIVDDEELVLSIAKDCLEELGYRVLTAENGTKALRTFSREHKNIDLIILDMIMPEMNGAECFKKIRHIDPDAKIIISSGFGEDADLKELRQQGLTGFIQKPYRIGRLSETVAAAIK